jgi:hypothetical protein
MITTATSSPKSLIIDPAYLNTEKIIKSFYVEDVTEDLNKLYVAFNLVAQNYSRFSSSNINFQEIYQELCDDPYHTLGLSRTLLLNGYNPNTNRVETLGTVRIVLGSFQPKNSTLPPLEAMQLISPLEGWDNFRFENFNANEAVELSRFATTFECNQGISKKIKLSHLVAKSLLTKAINFSIQKYQRKQIWAIMPRYVVKVITTKETQFSPVPYMTLNFQKHANLFQKYDKYWLHSHPWFYKITLGKVEVRANASEC